MGLKSIWLQSHLRRQWHSCIFYGNYLRLRRFFKNHGFRIKYLMGGHLWLDSLEVVITTKCNLRCPDCANLMQYYAKPYHVEGDRLITSMRKLSECFDWCDHYKILGREPFLYPNLKMILEEVPREKCGKVSIYTNATVIPGDPELFEVLRRKRINIILSNYSCAQETQRQLMSVLKREKISYEIVKSTTWINYGPMKNHGVSDKALKQQFLGCRIPCKSLLNGCLYYCPRSGHGYDLGIIDRKPGEYVDILHNTKGQNRRQIRSLMWRMEPIEACKYCLRGTDKAVKISRGK